MDIFRIHDEVLAEYESYVTSFLKTADERIRQYVERKISGERNLWPDALIQLNLAYEKGASVEELAAQGLLHPLCSDIFRTERGPYRLYEHQCQAIERGVRRESFVVTSGTGSGKTLTYFIPIFDAILRGNPQENKVHAIVVYPMNALVNSQLEQLSLLAEGFRARTGGELPVRFGRYTGQESRERKREMQTRPPHILLTNYVMLELMLVRPHERGLVDRATSELQFIVLDETHTYRGRRGADVAMLIRRLKERCGNPNLVCIGTSATMASGDTPAKRREAVAVFASTLFGTSVKPGNVMEETLARTIPRESTPTKAELRAALLGSLPAATWEAFSRDPLCAWIEQTFGLELEEGGRLCRRIPITLRVGAQKLADTTAVDLEKCEARLKQLLLMGSSCVKNPDGEPVFAFKVHQFISQGDSVYATIEDRAKRDLTMEGKYYAAGGGDRVLFPLRFCRICGQEYYQVVWDQGKGKVRPDLDRFSYLMEETEMDEIERGYLMIDSEGRWSNTPEALPEHFFDKRGKVKKDFQPHVPVMVRVRTDGEIVDEGEGDGMRCWFLRRPFMLCLHCGEAYTRRDKNDWRKLTGLSSEGRSTATTLLTLSTVTAMRGTDLDPSAQKILSFTDNRQDASLQAGHFNDFVQVALIRRALREALDTHGDLRFDNVGARVAESLGLTFREYAHNPDLDPGSSATRKAEEVLKQLIEYRIFQDLRRGWRVVQPNLEECGLLRIDYAGLAELATRDDLWQGVPLMGELGESEREDVLTVFLDEVRRRLAIDARCLQRDYQDELGKRVEGHLNEAWGLGLGWGMRYAGAFVMPGISKRRGDFSLGPTSVIGKWLKRSLVRSTGEDVGEEECENLVRGTVSALVRFGMLQESDPDGSYHTVQLKANAMIWRKGDGTPRRSPLRRQRAKNEVYEPVQDQANPFFAHYYRQGDKALRGMQSREHTAQIGYEARQQREELFREGKLPTLFCSPTMELGIDIRDLNAVHLRNVPPTPANYAQRSGRAGRAGQPALILTYASAFRGHDKYYFRRREKMVAGAVTLPRLDLLNEDLLRAHLHAIWLGHTRLDLRHSMDEIVDTDAEGYPVREEIRLQMQLSEERRHQCTEACRRAMESIEEGLGRCAWYNERWIEETVRKAPKSFDEALDRWRQLYSSAYHQLYEARSSLDKAYRRRGQKKSEEIKESKQMEREAQRQIELLLCINTKFDEADFYPYRYLASEGFLSGYNFPALPVRAYIPSGDRGEFIGRARYLALREFAPSNVIYHDGAKYSIEGVRLPLDDPEKRFQLAKLCKVCGYVHAGEDAHVDVCVNCGTQLGGDNSQILPNLLEMPSVFTRRRERITCDEEERLRYGYDITGHFRYAPAAGGVRDRQDAVALSTQGEAILSLTYAPAADIWHINHGWRRTLEKGFRLGMRSGRWKRKADSQGKGEGDAKGEEIRSGVRLFVHRTVNALLVRPPEGEGFDDDAYVTSLMHALLNGIQRAYQVEEGEIGAEILGSGDGRTIMLWEGTEGGLGVLGRLVEEPEAMAQVAQQALEILHFDAQTGEDLEPTEGEEGCARACYDCLLSYYNQRDHWLLDRHLVKDDLMRLSRSTANLPESSLDYEAHYESLRARTDVRSELEGKFLDHLFETRRKLPDFTQKPLQDVHSVPDFFYRSGSVCVFCDGSPHDEPQQKAEDRRIRSELEGMGYRVVVIRYDRAVEEQISEHEEVFG
ncbi:MAG: DEAD/DEAH box helicase [Chloroflexota bacterium]